MLPSSGLNCTSTVDYHIKHHRRSEGGHKKTLPNQAVSF